jgi:hypothetical protein
MLPALRRTVLDKLENVAGLHGLEGRIRVERVITPSDRPAPAAPDMAEALEAGWQAVEGLCTLKGVSDSRTSACEDYAR